MATDPNPEQHLAMAQAEEILREVLQRLDEELRTVFLMAEIDQIPHAEVAAALGISESTLQSRLRRARVEVAKALRQKRADRSTGALVVPFALLSSTALRNAINSTPDAPPGAEARVWSRLCSSLPLQPARGTTAATFALAATLSFMPGEVVAMQLHDILTSAPEIAAGAVAVNPGRLQAFIGGPATSPGAAAGLDPNTAYRDMKILQAAYGALRSGNRDEAQLILELHTRAYPKSPNSLLRARLLEQVRGTNAE